MISNIGKWYIVVNPVAGSGRGGKLWPKAAKLLTDKGVEFDYGLTDGRNHAIQLAKEAVEAGYSTIIAMGGDGTANEVVNGIMLQTAIPTKDISFGLIPVGTGNDWIKTYRLPSDYKKAIDLLVITQGRFQDIGLVRYERNGQNLSRYFYNVAGMGYDAFVTKASNEEKNFVSSKLFYFLLIFKCLWKYKSQKGKITFLDETGKTQVYEDVFYSLNVGICIYNGAGAQFVPQAVPDDGLMALTIVGDVTKAEVVANTPKIYNGTLLGHPKINGYQARHVKVESLSDGPILLEVDGEYLGGTTVEFEIFEKALKVMV